jgi:NAD(P)-dependent dehydrogenase (short-subunit alcohol dehydrogenase family)
MTFQEIPQMNDRKVALIIGAGDATGGAIARRFAREGFTVCLTRRTREPLEPLLQQIEGAGGKAFGFGSDARIEEQVVSLFETIERDIGPVEVLVFNIGGNVNFPIAETTERVFRKVWEMCCLAGFLNAREAAKLMMVRGRGTILFTGATASLRGGSGFSAFAAGKHALRAVAQSMARELGPKNIHVAHVVIDGGIDTAFTQQRNPERYASLKPQDGILNPDAIADNYWNLHCQHRSAWTHELDLRPWIEKW